MTIAKPAMTDGLESAAMTKRTIVVVEMRILKVFIRSDKEGQNKKRAHQRDIEHKDFGTEGWIAMAEMVLPRETTGYGLCGQTCAADTRVRKKKTGETNEEVFGCDEGGYAGGR